jgi:predicted secreted protein
MFLWRSLQSARQACVWALLGASWWPVLAQEPPVERPVVQLSATAQQAVPQDWLTVVLMHRAQAADAATVQRQLQTTLDLAMRHLKPRAQAGGWQVSTGALGVQPRHSREGQIVGWQGSVEVVLQGQDAAAIGAAASQTPGMSVSQMGFSLSRSGRQALESEMRRDAIARFRAQAQELALALGYSGYRLREVAVSEAGEEHGIRPRLLMAADAGPGAASAPLLAEPGKTQVQVSVSGSVWLY